MTPYTLRRLEPGDRDTRALRFYQRAGLGHEGIPIRDEMELEMEISQ